MTACERELHRCAIPIKYHNRIIDVIDSDTDAYTASSFISVSGSCAKIGIFYRRARYNRQALVITKILNHFLYLPPHSSLLYCFSISHSPFHSPFLSLSLSLFLMLHTDAIQFCARATIASSRSLCTVMECHVAGSGRRYAADTNATNNSK